MSEKIAVVYIGPKPVKKDTLTGSRTLFPRLDTVYWILRISRGVR
ncbi:hypothetical protein ACSALJ_004768, partial [Escherichia coli]